MNLIPCRSCNSKKQFLLDDEADPVTGLNTALALDIRVQYFEPEVFF